MTTPHAERPRSRNALKCCLHYMGMPALAALSALALAAGTTSPALADTIAVTGNCTLIDAINAANNDAETGDCSAGNGEDTLVLDAGATYTLTEQLDYEGGAGTACRESVRQ